MDTAGIILTGIFSLIFGLLGGGLYTIFKIKREERRARKDYKAHKNIFEVKNSPNQVIMPSEKPLVEVKDNLIPQVAVVDDPKQKKIDYKRFKEANKILEDEKRKYEKGKVSYQELEQKFKYFQSQPYYQKVSKEMGVKI